MMIDEEGREERRANEVANLKSLRIYQEGDGWIVVYERLEDGAPQCHKYGSFAEKARAEHYWMACYCLYLLDAPVEVITRNAPMLAQLESLRREWLEF